MEILAITLNTNKNNNNNNNNNNNDNSDNTSANNGCAIKEVQHKRTHNKMPVARGVHCSVWTGTGPKTGLDRNGPEWTGPCIIGLVHGPARFQIRSSVFGPVPVQTGGPSRDFVRESSLQFQTRTTRTLPLPSPSPFASPSPSPSPSPSQRLVPARPAVFRWAVVTHSTDLPLESRLSPVPTYSQSQSRRHPSDRPCLAVLAPAHREDDDDRPSQPPARRSLCLILRGLILDSGAVLPEDRSGLGPVRFGPGFDWSGPVQDRLQIGPVFGPRFDTFSVLGPAGPVRSWTDEHPYQLHRTC
ncbi:hypothetical protein Cgig2_009148 [Carnegiea gigantea]|uniref:Uncharacterized protein n=1 Tax=Carnegiea gigantea TaxID=171969 RepID=A0A9Q1GRV5_9CARY|nr:hypothetical protein Cgig2_009148 [Carnegiea gigantea]